MNIAQIIDGIGGFAGGLANALQQQQGSSELGDALSALYGGGQSGGGPMSGASGGGASPSPMIPMVPDSGSGQAGGQYQGRTNLGLPSAAGNPGMGAGPLAAALQSQAAQPATAHPGPSPASMNGGNYGYSAPPQQQQLGSPVGATQQAQAAPGAQQQTAGAKALGGGPLTLAGLVGAIKQQHPGISGQHLAAAVTRAIPLLNMEGLQQYRELGLQLREEQMKNLQLDRADRSADRKQGMRDRMQMSSDRIQEQNARHAEDIQFKLKSLAQSKDLKEARGYAQDLRAAIKDKLEATNHQIQMQYSLTDDQKADLYKQAQADAKRANEQLDKLLEQKGKGGEAGGKETSANDKKDNAGAGTKLDLKTEKANAEAAIKQMPDKADAIRRMYKERTGQDLGPQSKRDTGMQLALDTGGGNGGTWYTKKELEGPGLQMLIDNAEGDEDLGKVVHSLMHHGAMIPHTLGGVAPIGPVS